MKKTFVVLLLIGRLASVSDARAADGKIRFYTYHLNETKEITYAREGKSNSEGLAEINELFRSRDSGKILPVDPELIRLLDEIEDHFQVRQVEVICGYRSADFNKSLKETGHKVANESYHIRGMAADIHLDEITEEDLSAYVLSLHRGGVGYYPSLNMVHVDVGPVRQWEETAPRKDWVGEKNDRISVTIKTSFDRSYEKKLPSVSFEPRGARASWKEAYDVEFFDRGHWKKKDGDVSEWPYGKYRLKFFKKDDASEWQYSNEFYFKKPPSY